VHLSEDYAGKATPRVLVMRTLIKDSLAWPPVLTIIAFRFSMFMNQIDATALQSSHDCGKCNVYSAKLPTATTNCKSCFNVTFSYGATHAKSTNISLERLNTKMCADGV